MAEFTNYLQGGGPVKPARSPVAPLDPVTPIANFATGVVNVIGNQRVKSQKAERDALALKKAQDEALIEQGLDELAGATFDVMSDHNMKLMLNRLDNVNSAVKAGAASPSRVDMELERVINTVRQKYPTAQKEIFDWLDQRGYNNYVLQAFQDEQAQIGARRDAFAAQTTAYIQAYTEAGLDPSQPEDYQIERGRQLLFDQNNLEMLKEESNARKAALDAEQAATDARMKDLSQKTRQAYIEVGGNFVQPLHQNLSQLLVLAGNNDEKLQGINEQASTVMAAVDSFILGQMADARASAMLPADITQVEKYYEDVRSQVQDMFTGDLSAFKTKVRALDLMETSGQINARQQFPTITRLQDAGLSGTMNDILTLTLETTATATQLRDELVASLNQDGSPNASAGDAIIDAASSAATSGQYGEGLDTDAIHKAAMIQTRAQKRKISAANSGELTSETELTEFLNTQQALNRLAVNYPHTTIDRDAAYAMADTLASDATMQALLSGQNVDHVRGTLALRSSGAAAVNILKAMQLQATEFRRDAVDNDTPNRLALQQGARSVKYENGKYVAVGDNFLDVSPEMRKHVEKMNQVVQFIEDADKAADLGGSVFKTPEDRREFLVNGIIPANVIATLDQAPNPDPQEEGVNFGDALSAFSSDLVTSLAPQSRIGRHLDGVRSQIDAVENGGTGDYDTLYNFSHTSEFADIDVTKMTLAELDNFEKVYGPWVQENNPEGNLATPMGRYQIVGTTRRELAQRLGLSPATRFTPEVQDMMFEELMGDIFAGERTLEDTWVGLKK